VSTSRVSIKANLDTWAVEGAVDLELTPKFKKLLKKEDVEPTLCFRIKYKPDKDAYKADDLSKTENWINLKTIQEIQEEFEKKPIKGRLKIGVIFARNLVTHDGSIKTKITPRVQAYIVPEKVIKSPESEGINPDWNFFQDLDFSLTRKKVKELHFEVLSGDQFLGESIIPMANLLRYPGRWVINGVIDLQEKDKNVQTGEAKESVGKILVQAMFIVPGMKDLGKYPPKPLKE